VTTQTPIRIRLAKPDIGHEEVEAAGRVLRSGVLTNGPATKEFEELFAARHQTSHAVAFANGTVALTAIYLGLGLRPGDEVIVPSMTFVSSATSVSHMGGVPVFADVRPDTFTLDPSDVARRITDRTRAILAVHYGGQSADIDELQALATDRHLHLIEDAAQAHGGSYHGRPVGSLGVAAMFSFTPTKNITTGEGGMVTTHDAELAERMRLLRNHGQTALYQHASLGYNWRITEMQAAIGVVQLGKLDAILAKKNANALALGPRLTGIPGVIPPVHLADRGHTYMLYTTLVDGSRDRVLRDLNAQGIEARLYFPPIHQQQVYAHSGAHLPVTEDLSARMLSLPFHAQLTLGEFDDIVSTLASVMVS
jgi:perosamine synthetase